MIDRWKVVYRRHLWRSEERNVWGKLTHPSPLSHFFIDDDGDDDNDDDGDDEDEDDGDDDKSKGKVAASDVRLAGDDWHGLGRYRYEGEEHHLWPSSS